MFEDLELPDDLKALEKELSSIRYEERPSFGPELEAELASLRQTVVYGGKNGAVAVVVTEDDRPLDLEAWNEFATRLDPSLLPQWVKRVAAIPMTDGYRPLKRALVEAGLEGDVYEREGETFVPLSPEAQTQAGKPQPQVS